MLVARGHCKLLIIGAACTGRVVCCFLGPDALFVNHTLSLEPWTQYMEKEKIDQLLSSDIIRESPINFGVFFVSAVGA